MYKELWRIRKTQLIIVNIIFAIIGLYFGFYKNYGWQFFLFAWLGGSWIAATVISAFTNTEDKISSLARVIGAAIISGILYSLSSGNSILVTVLFAWNLAKAVIGIVAISVILIFNFVIFPFTTVYYFAKSKQEYV